LRVLFICSGNSKAIISPVIKNQAEALEAEGVLVDIYAIRGKGLLVYLKHIFLLKKYLIGKTYDIFHAHYSLSAFVATIAGSKPLVVSLMGSDVHSGRFILNIIQYFSKKRWNRLIVKSPSMKELLRHENAHVIPNGVDLLVFKPFDDLSLKMKFGFSINKKILLFLADPGRQVKNIILAEKAYKILARTDVELQIKYNLPKDEIPEILNAADVILLTSLWEGSPNVIKEAMACNKPVVATNVGDIVWLFGDKQGYYITGFDPADVAEKISLAIEFVKNYGKTSGRERIIEMGLDSATFAKRVIGIYQSVFENNAE
jgi:glycosyltransferase involved in cell wall biosynthesis